MLWEALTLLLNPDRTFVVADLVSGVTHLPLIVNGH